MSASKAPEHELISSTLITHSVHSCPIEMEHWLEAETELMRLYNEYTALELLEMLQPEAWAKSYRAS